jgi:Flp pilus assembly protein TadG
MKIPLISPLRGRWQIPARQRGSAAVEFALLLVPLLLLSFGVVEYGRAIYQYNTLVKSVRAAARLLSSQSPDSEGYGKLVAEARCLTVHGNVDCLGPVLVPKLSVASVKVCDRKSWSECKGSNQDSYRSVPTGQGSIHLVSVRIDGYAFPLIGLPLVTTGPTISFGPIEAVMRQAG